MILLGYRKLSREDHSLLVQTAQELLLSGTRTAYDIGILHGFEGITISLNQGRTTIHALPGPVNGLLGFWMVPPSEEYREP